MVIIFIKFFFLKVKIIQEVSRPCNLFAVIYAFTAQEIKELEVFGSREGFILSSSHSEITAPHCAAYIRVQQVLLRKYRSWLMMLTFSNRKFWTWVDKLQRGFNCHCFSTGFPLFTMSVAFGFCPFNWAFSNKVFSAWKCLHPSADSCAIVKTSLRFLFYTGVKELTEQKSDSDNRRSRQWLLNKNRRHTGACDYCLKGGNTKNRIVLYMQLCGEECVQMVGS